MTPIQRFTLLTLCVAAASGCDDGSDDRELEDRELVFDGAEVREMLAADPDASFFVDLRGRRPVRFVQDEVPLEFDHFLVQCPSMPHPIPMVDFASMLDLELHWPEFSVQSASEGDDFREEVCRKRDLLCLEEDTLEEDCIWTCR